jgi:CHAT domain-containing protein
LYQATGKSIYQDLFFEYSEKSKYFALLGAMYKEKKPVIQKEKSNNNYKTVNVTFEDLLLKINNKIPLNNPTEYYKKRFENQLDYYTKEQNQVAFQDKNQIITLAETQKNLKENEAIIIYNIAPNQYYFHPYLLVITKREKQIIGLDVGKFLSHSKPEIELLTASLSNNTIGNYKKLAFEYYKRYFKPAEAYLPKSITHIQIVPNAVYGNFPFDMLLTQDTKSNDFRKLPYLGKKYNFSYALSASISKILSKNKSKSSSFSVFTPSFKNNLSELKYVKKVSKSIVTDYNAQLIKETNASKTAFSNHLANDKIIAILSHGKATTDEDETKKGIYFSDGFLSMNEVYNLKSDCDFLLLGACETGVGLDLHKEGTINLARAFTSIGVKSMMLASWKIDEESSMKIMELFLKHLNQGDTKSEALQKAKLEFLATASPRTANPIYWAGLNIVGNNDTVLLEENNYYWWSFVLVFPVVGGFLYWRRRKKMAECRF